MSGLSHTPGKRAWGKTHRGFESRPLRQKVPKSRLVRLFLCEARVVRAWPERHFSVRPKHNFLGLDAARNQAFSQSAIFTVGFCP